ncbi:MGMT family protein [Flavobacteriaceae bacterium]|jgi:methylated-DNA-protein-cysteine methyltransferase-like protein|nr:MGMT family protein [Flavobacteriaceae bacterium]MBT4313181.1 MGMT family protein [Flavobacteriaceae bacterium]MBT5091224.1 MGMT family protein [Flavobacteriaceae bacterium]MBT5282891.1 MGMT family protein [Flavobacteriaceae bacterium]MBT5446592.1 MGMT family protein [Flavobacteriaceae bacterium]|tara:strand:+ start:4122 stop:4460 length:339 start_codon:yes stop_codon:yes gene_type:complete
MSQEDSFFLKVYGVVKQIPEGKVTTYGAIARYLGSPQSSRMVGWAMNASHSNSEVPAHRVVNRKGLLTGKHHFGGGNIMEQLLGNEGVKVEQNQIQNLEHYFWDPSLELSSF